MIKNKDIAHATEVLDAVLELYGDVSYLFRFLEDNPQYTSGTDSVGAGAKLTYDDALVYNTPAQVAEPTTTQLKTLVIREGQDILDLSIQLYGDASGVFALMKANNLEIHDTGLAGRQISYVEQSFSLPAYFKKNRVSIVNGESFYSTVYLTRAFSTGFSLGFS